MNKVVVKAVSLLSLVAFVLSGCLDVETATVYCDRAYIVYTDDDVEPNTYSFQAFRLPEQVPVSDKVSVSGNGSVTIPFYETLDEGIEVYLMVNDQWPFEPFAVECSNTGTRVEHAQWFEPGDDRINRQAYAYASVYCDADNERVGIYGIHSPGVGDPDRNDGSGFPAIFVPYAELPPVPADQNVLISEYRGIQFYRLTTGEYQVNAGPDPEGKTYVLVWDGCPQTYIRASMLQNGVLTQTEVYPRAE